MNVNVGDLLTEAAAKWPDHPAIAEPSSKLREPSVGSSPAGWKSLTFQQLEHRVNRIANGMVQAGLKPGTRMALLVPPGIDFVAHVFALFKVGAIIVLIDPGIGRKNLIACMAESEPQGVVGVPKAQIARWLFRKRLPHAKLNFVVGNRSWPRCHSVRSYLLSCKDSFSTVATQADSEAAIIFTSGSTGPPKGVSYQHGNFIKQATEIRDYFDIEPGGADVSGFPLFALFNTAMGKTTVFPKMDFTRPARVDPQEMLNAATDWKADQSFGSPALWNTVSRWCEANRKGFPTIKRVMTAGAPVPAHVLKRVRKVISPQGDVFTPYGATEALPVACISATTVLGETASLTDRGHGVCVGNHFAGIQWRLIGICDEPIRHIEDAVSVDQGERGELIVSGEVVTRRYVTRTEANALHKIGDGNRFWHRMGDVGYFDEKNRFWFCGRKSQRVRNGTQTWFTVPCESIFNSHPAIYRSALVGVGPARNQSPVMVVEPWPEHRPTNQTRRKRLLNELTELGQQSDLTKSIAQILFIKNLPVDIRHNSKIFRERLAPWVEKRI